MPDKVKELDAVLRGRIDYPSVAEDVESYNKESFTLWRESLGEGSLPLPLLGHSLLHLSAPLSLRKQLAQPISPTTKPTPKPLIRVPASLRLWFCAQASQFVCDSCTMVQPPA